MERKATLMHALLASGPLLVFVLLGASVSAQADAAKSWSGVIINSGCTADEAFAEAPKCFEKAAGTKLVLYDDTTRQIFQIDPPGKAAGHLGDAVTVRGTLDGDTIRGASVELLTHIGLAVGQKAPGFALRDQFGHAQTLESLRGPWGTVLLFFRSADW